MSPEKLTKYEKVNQDMAYAALAVLAFCVVLSIAVAWLTAEFPELVKAMPHVFNGKEVVNGSDSPNYIRNSAEFLNFITAGLGAIALAAVAIWALRFARQQANEATNTRLSGIYMEIVEKWQSDKLLDSREKLFRLIYKYEDNRDNAEMASFTNAQEYIFYYLRELYDKRKLRELYSYTILIQFFEDLGYLSYKNYVRKEDIFDFMGGSILTQLGHYGEYIKDSRNTNGTIRKSLYANAIYLYKKNLKFRQSRSLHEQDMWQIEKTD